MKLKSFFAITALLVMQSCGNNDIKHEIEIFMSAPVDLALDSMQNALELTTCSQPIDKTVPNYILVHYVDSTNCTECAISHLTEWQYFQNKLSENGNVDIKLSFKFVISPPRKLIKNINELLVLNPEMNKDIYIDTTGIFEKQNPHLPKSQILHTFLLDKKGNILLVGNPLRNERIEGLMIKIIRSGPNSFTRKEK